MPAKAITIRDDLVVKINRIHSAAKAFTVGTVTEEQFTVRAKNLSLLSEAFENIHRDLLAILKDEQLSEQKALEERVDQMIFEIEVALPKPKPPTPVKPDVRQTPSPFVALPQLSLPTFNGDIFKFAQFRDLFIAAVRSKGLSDAQRLQYLLSSLVGEPRTLVQHLDILDSHYDLAWTLLTERYDNRRVVLEMHIKQLLHLPPLSSGKLANLQAFYNSVAEHIKALEALKVSTNELVWFVMIAEKLDHQTRVAFERYYRSDDHPTINSLLKFLRVEINVLQSAICDPALQASSKGAPQKELQRHASWNKPKSAQTFVSQTTSNSGVKCPNCNTSHPLYACPKFKGMNVPDRRQLVQKKHLCFNCLKASHSASSCPSQSVCRHCEAHHHSLLHLDKPVSEPQLSSDSAAGPPPLAPSRPSENAVSLFVDAHRATTVLLATAVVRVLDRDQQPHEVRAIIDTGSQLSYISQACAQRLRLPQQHSSVSATGLGGSRIATDGRETRLTVLPRSNDNLSLSVSATIVKRIAKDLPSITVHTDTFDHLHGLQLADPLFNVPGTVDMLLAADIFPSILMNGKRSGPPNTPVALETEFGWIIMGKAPTVSDSSHHTFFLQEDDGLEGMIKRFWEIEEVKYKTHPLSNDELFCEDFFTRTTLRDESGRYAVRLPFCKAPAELGDSLVAARKCYESLRRRLAKNPELERQYVEFMRDYADQLHMSLVPPEDECATGAYYIPHHAVLRPDSVTTKLRVVFNASQVSTTGLSLNDILHQGPMLLNDLTGILIRFRFHAVAIMADIRQAFRQIIVQPEDRNFQRILWSFDSSKPPQTYRLTTVTYGENCSPFLMLRVLKQLAKDERSTFPLGCHALETDSYVDDIITGAATKEDAVLLHDQLNALCKRGGFELRKWTSNDPSVFRSQETVPSRSLDLEFSDAKTVKVLGLQWSPESDHMSYSIRALSKKCTKRTILSEIARIYDPLGLLAPLLMRAKILIQDMWVSGLDWDQQAPAPICDVWNQIRCQLPILNTLHIPRLISAPSPVTIIGFCDASLAGYAAVIYARSAAHNAAPARLLCAKTKVAPLKRITVPRLELNAALLLARLVDSVKRWLTQSIDRIYAYSDSTITLSWISTSPHALKTYESNRVAEIQCLLSPSCWNHVKSQDNPADVASRGLLPQELLSTDIWWKGPSWINAELPTCRPTLSDDTKTTTVLLSTVHEDDILSRFSSLPRLLRVTAYMSRLLRNPEIRKLRASRSPQLSLAELQAAEIRWVKIVQSKVYANELHQLKTNKQCSRHIGRLSPFLDEKGLIRVGGRIARSDVEYQRKHPILLPGTHRFTKLLIDFHHRANLHCGPLALQAALTRRYWFSRARQSIRSVLGKCHVCLRANPVFSAPKMSDLPASRVQRPSKPFEVTGTDFGGPFTTTLNRSRGSRPIKTYLCLFVCFATKAVHLEAVTDLSTPAFIAALQRFIARRGRCHTIHSDCGTNYKGAARYLNDIAKFLSPHTQEELTRKAAATGINWIFNPPSAPHFGGIWEAGIRSVKKLLVRTIGQQMLTFEEFATVLAQIEAQLNSRPLYALSSDPNDLEVLTPGHFLIGEALTALPDPDLRSQPRAMSHRWQLVQQIQQSFWKRWSTEYLNSLQQRNKWLAHCCSPKPGSIVLIRDDTAPPLLWRKGRVIEEKPGPDNVTRVVLLRTATGIVTRPVVKLCLLPTEEEAPTSE